jgi:hypothetical protein
VVCKGAYLHLQGQYLTHLAWYQFRNQEAGLFWVDAQQVIFTFGAPFSAFPCEFRVSVLSVLVSKLGLYFYGWQNVYSLGLPLMRMEYLITSLGYNSAHNITTVLTH